MQIPARLVASVAGRMPLPVCIARMHCPYGVCGPRVRCPCAVRCSLVYGARCVVPACVWCSLVCDARPRVVPASVRCARVRCPYVMPLRSALTGVHRLGVQRLECRDWNASTENASITVPELECLDWSASTRSALTGVHRSDSTN